MRFSPVCVDKISTKAGRAKSPEQEPSDSRTRSSSGGLDGIISLPRPGEPTADKRLHDPVAREKAATSTC